MNRSPFCLGLLLVLAWFPVFSPAQVFLPAISARSVSGQFVVMAAPQVSFLANQPFVLTNKDLVRLDPALLAVSAERIKKLIWQQLGIDDERRWTGQVTLVLRAARSLDENVTIASGRFNGAWNYRVDLPDIIARDRFTRAITGVVLLELANRNAGDRSAEVPNWLVEGLTQQWLALNSDVILSSSTGANGPAGPRFITMQPGLDGLTGVRRVLKEHSTLTFEQLSWPTEPQLSGDDGGVYRASAQLFVNQLVQLRNGPAGLREMLRDLPRFYNWQMAFRAAFRSTFGGPVEIEKWWAIQTVNFAAADAGPMWTAATSRNKLDEILAVAVEMRIESNSLPAHAEISLQSVIRNYEPERRTSLLQVRARDLELAELRMSPPFARLTADYIQAINDFLGQGPMRKPLTLGKHPVLGRKATAAETLKRLDALDTRRRALELSLEPSAMAETPFLTGSKSNL